jgi:ribonuclease HI
MDSLVAIKQYPQADVAKGKWVIQGPGCVQAKDGQVKKPAQVVELSKWCPPPLGWVKLSVDGSYMQEEGDGAAGMVLRGSDGELIFSACRYLSTCTSALEAELAAAMEGIALAKQWSSLPVIVETDASEVVRLVCSNMGDRSSMSSLVGEIKQLIKESVEIKVVNIKREQNIVSHALASFGRTSRCSMVWPRSGPVNIPTLCRRDCNLLS